MKPPFPTVLALDFDGVLCDGLKEYFLTAWQAYCQIWRPASTTPPEGLADAFYRLRPVIETGWEMPVLLWALLHGVAEDAIVLDWVTLAKQIVLDEQRDAKQLITAVDGVRDRWIATDLNGWLAEHRFYPGVIERLKAALASDTQVAIISTKEGRFIQQLLQEQGVDLTDVQIYGKEVKRPKYEILRDLIQIFGPAAGFWFVEDRLNTLYTVMNQLDLMEVQLFLADWGYNLPAERHAAAQQERIHLISLAQFAADFSAWYASEHLPSK